jgi:hypothetical protein
MARGFSVKAGERGGPEMRCASQKTILFGSGGLEPGKPLEFSVSKRPRLPMIWYRDIDSG